MAQEIVPSGNPLTIPMPERDDVGPAMQELTDLEFRFVVAWFHLGDKTRAAAAAGYSMPNPNAAKQQVFHVWHRPRVQAAIREFAQTTGISMLIPGAIEAVRDILEDKSHKDRAKVAEMIWNRTGMHAMTEHKMTVSHVDGSREKQIQQIIALAKATGQDPKALLGSCDDITDADYEVLNKETGKDGLEDLL